MRKMMLVVVALMSACDSAVPYVTEDPAPNADGSVILDGAVAVPNDMSPPVADTPAANDLPTVQPDASVTARDGSVPGGNDVCAHRSERCSANIFVQHDERCGFASKGFINSHLRKIAKLSCERDRGRIYVEKNGGRNPDWCVFGWRKVTCEVVAVMIQCSDDGVLHRCLVHFSKGK